jgi:hypothetical protein
MTALKSLTFTTVAKIGANSTLDRRAKVIERLEEQKLLLNDPTYKRTIRTSVKKDGERTTVEKHQRVLPWWRSAQNGTYAYWRRLNKAPACHTFSFGTSKPCPIFRVLLPPIALMARAMTKSARRWADKFPKHTYHSRSFALARLWRLSLRPAIAFSPRPRRNTRQNSARLPPLFLRCTEFLLR